MTHLLYTSFSEADVVAFKPAMKLGLLATVNDEGLPHLTLISTFQVGSPTQLTWGQFTEGVSKQYVHRHPQVGFMVMTLNKELWRGKATFTHTARQGPEYDAYNAIPMFRYNAYFGIHTVYFMELVAHTGRQPLPMGRVVFAAVQTLLARTLLARTLLARTLPARKGAAQPVLNLWTRRLLNKLDALKFVAYVGEDGYPVIVPVIQAQSLDRERVLFSMGAFGDELRAIPAGAPLAVFGMTLDMEDVLLRGAFEGFRRVGGVLCGSVKVNWVYNPMPPTPGQIYPAVPLDPVRTF